MERYLTKYKGEGEERNFFENKESVREELNKPGKELTGSRIVRKITPHGDELNQCGEEINLFEGELKEFKGEPTGSVDN